MPRFKNETQHKFIEFLLNTFSHKTLKRSENLVFNREFCIVKNKKNHGSVHPRCGTHMSAQPTVGQ